MFTPQQLYLVGGPRCEGDLKFIAQQRAAPTPVYLGKRFYKPSTTMCPKGHEFNLKELIEVVPKISFQLPLFPSYNYLGSLVAKVICINKARLIFISARLRNKLVEQSKDADLESNKCLVWYFYDCFNKVLTSKFFLLVLRDEQDSLDGKENNWDGLIRSPLIFHDGKRVWVNRMEISYGNKWFFLYRVLERNSDEIIIIKCCF